MLSCMKTVTLLRSTNNLARQLNHFLAVTEICSAGSRIQFLHTDLSSQNTIKPCHQPSSSLKQLNPSTCPCCNFGRNSNFSRISSRWTSSLGSSAQPCPSQVVTDPTLSATTVVQASLNVERRWLDIVWNDGESTQYPFMWLRDSCQCPQCFHQGAQQRTILFHEVYLEATPNSVETDSQKQKVIITWPDGHRSSYGYQWLLARSFRQAEQEMRARLNGRTPQLWGAELINNMPTLNYDQFLRDEKTQYDWITTLEETAFVLIKNAPLERGVIQKIADVTGFLRNTNYGAVSTVQTKNNPSNVAYTSGTLVLHNDLAYFNFMPGMQMMHCIEQASGEGGKNVFVDGFQAAKQLREQNAEQFRILSSTVVDFYDIGQDFIEFHQMSRHPTIGLNEEGQIYRIAFSSHGRDNFLRLPLDSVEPFYKALKAFAKLLYDPKNRIDLKLQPGDVVCFDNWRVLHGRHGFELKPGDSRILEHGYIDWDEMHSRRRVLKRKLGVPDELY